MRGCKRLWLLFIAFFLLRDVAGSEGDPELDWISKSIASQLPVSADTSFPASTDGVGFSVGSTDTPVYALSESGLAAPVQMSSAGPDSSSDNLLGSSAGVQSNVDGAVQSSTDSQSQVFAFSSNPVERPGFGLSSPQVSGPVFMLNTRVSSGGVLPVAAAPSVQRDLGSSIQVTPDQKLQDGAFAQGSGIVNLAGVNYQIRPASSPVAQPLSGSVSTPQRDFGTQYSKSSSPPVWGQTVAAFPSGHAVLFPTPGVNSQVNIASDTTSPSQGTSTWQQAYQSNPFHGDLSQGAKLNQYRQPGWYSVSQDSSITSGVQIPGTQLQGGSQSLSSAGSGSLSGSLSPYGSMQTSWGMYKPGVSSDFVQKPSGTPTCPFAANVSPGTSSGISLTGSGTLPGISGRYAGLQSILSPNAKPGSAPGLTVGQLTSGSQVTSSDAISSRSPSSTGQQSPQAPLFPFTSMRQGGVTVLQPSEVKPSGVSSSRTSDVSQSSSSFGSSQGFPNQYGVPHTSSQNNQQAPASDVALGQQAIGLSSGSSTGTSQSSIGFGSTGLSSIYGGVKGLWNPNANVLRQTIQLGSSGRQPTLNFQASSSGPTSSVPQSPSSTGQMSSLSALDSGKGQRTQTTSLGSTGLLVGLQTSGLGSQVVSSDTPSSRGVSQSPSSTGSMSPYGPLYAYGSMPRQVTQVKSSFNFLQPGGVTASSISSSRASDSQSSASLGVSQGFPSKFDVQSVFGPSTQQVPTSGLTFAQQSIGSKTTLSGSSTGSSTLSSSYGVQDLLNQNAQLGGSSGLTVGQTSSSQMTSSDTTSSRSVSQSPSSTGQLSPQMTLLPYSSILRKGTQTPDSLPVLQPSGVKTGVSPSYSSDTPQSPVTFGYPYGFPSTYVQSVFRPSTQQVPTSGLTFDQQSIGSKTTLSGSSTGSSTLSSSYGGVQGLLNQNAQLGSGSTVGKTSVSQMTFSDTLSTPTSVSQSLSSTGQLSPQGPLFPYSGPLSRSTWAPGSFTFLQPSGVKTGVSPSYSSDIPQSPASYSTRGLPSRYGAVQIFSIPDTQQTPASGLAVGLQSSSTGMSQSSTGSGQAQVFLPAYDLQRQGTQNFNLIPTSSMSGISGGSSSTISSSSSTRGSQSSNVYGDFQGLSTYVPVQGQDMQSQRDFTQLGAASGLTNQPTCDTKASSTSGLSTSVSGGSQSSPGSSFMNRIAAP